MKARGPLPSGVHLAAREIRHAGVLCRRDEPGRAGRPSSGGLCDPAWDRCGVGETDSIAREKAAYLGSLVNAEFGVAEMSNAIGSNLAGHDIDTPLGELELKQGARGVLDVILQSRRPESLTEYSGRTFREHLQER